MAGQVGIVKKIETIAPGLLNPSVYNPRTISPQEFAKLRRSLREFGFVEPVVVNNGNKIVGGHQRVRAAIEEGLKRVPIVRLDLPEKKAKALNLALNRISGEWDLPLLKNLLGELDTPDFDIEITGFDETEVAEIMQATSSQAEKVDPADLLDHSHELQKKWRVRSGQAWRIESHTAKGKAHQIVCGDSLSPEICERVVDGTTPSLMFTDPPWNIAIGGDSNPRHRQRLGMPNDRLLAGDYKGFLQRFVASASSIVQGDIYCVFGAVNWPLLDAIFREAGFHWSATIIWVKDIFVLGRSKYHRRYETIWYGWPRKSKSTFMGSRRQDDVWEIARPRISNEHPTMKPVELVVRAITNSSRHGQLVWDPFLGSGTTAIAAEQMGRVCSGVEIEPRYVAVALERLKNLGLEPSLTK